MSPQTPSRRRGAAAPTPPARRPRVAGLRKPASDAPPADSTPVDEPRDTEVIPVVKDDVEAPAAEKPSPRPRKRATTENRPGWEAAPRVRRSGTLLSEDDEPVSDTDSEAVSEAAEEKPSRWPNLVAAASGKATGGLFVPVALAVVTVLLGGFAVFAGVQYAHLRGGVSVQNTALTDNAGTSEVIGEVTSAVNTLFSYNYTDLAKTQNAVKTLLTGNAVCQYNAIFQTVQQQAPSQKLVLTTTVMSSAVQMLQGDTARVLLVVDQKDIRATTNQSSEAGAFFAVNAIRTNGKWQISAIDTFNGPVSTTCPAK